MAKRLGASVTIIRERTVDACLEETDLVTKKAAEVLIRLFKFNILFLK